jgi:hypothetical protein
MGFWKTIISEFKSESRKLIDLKCIKKNQNLSDELDFFTLINNGSIRYSDDYITINNYELELIKKVPFLKKDSDGWRLYEDPRGTKVSISPLGEKGTISLFHFKSKEVKCQIVFNLIDF